MEWELLEKVNYFARTGILKHTRTQEQQRKKETTDIFNIKFFKKQ